MIEIIKIVILVLCVLCIVMLYLIYPSVRKNPDRKRLQGLYIAHRGLHGLYEDIPENSLPAFSYAVEKGYPVEIDIRLTADKKIVVFHDASLKRMCGDARKPEECTLAELKELSLKGTCHKIPTLKESLSVISAKVPVLIEFKCADQSYKTLCVEADRILSEYKGDYFIQSFYPFVLWWYRKNRRDILRGQLASTFRNRKKAGLAKKLLGCLVFNFIARPDFISYEYMYEKNIFRRICCRLGALPVGWTFRSRQELKKYNKCYEAWIFENFLPVRGNTNE